jgi:deoxyribodipyrimidine photolyase-related protein
MDGRQPIGGKWNLDKDNRKPLPKSFRGEGSGHEPNYASPDRDPIVAEVAGLVEKFFADHYGRGDGFAYAVTREQALRHLEAFFARALPYFGDYQDAMSSRHWLLYHSLISYLLNFGLLRPLEVVRGAEAEYHAGRAALNAVEGFVRQVLGWREFVRAIYDVHMPRYRQLNYFRHDRALPDWMWTAQTDMNCLAHAISQTVNHAYAHHIQRLMVIGNFCLLAGMDPQQVCEWYLIVYIDALEWAELPNTLGMSQYGDGGIVGTKPYVASGKYIDRMSDYCRGCRYDVRKTVGEDACPFNYLYWDFLDRHQDKLRSNPRLGFAMRNLACKSESELSELSEIREQSKRFLQSLPSGKYGASA